MSLLNAIAVLGYIGTLVFIFKKYPRYFTFFLFVSFMQLWALISCFYNDTGIYNLELFRFTEQTMATTRLGIMYVLFNIGFIAMAYIIGDKALINREYTLKGGKIHLGNFTLLIYFGVLAIALYLVYRLSVNGIPIFAGLDRLRYVKQAGTIEQLLVVYGQLIAFMLGLFGNHRKLFSFPNVVFAGFLVYAVLTGHKFSFLFILLISYTTPLFIRYVYAHSDFKLFRFRYMMVATVVCTVFLLLAYNTYRRIFDGFEGAQTLLVNRVFAMQGEMWWAIDYDRTTFDTYDSRHWQTELARVLSPESTPVEEVGMRYLMVQAVGPKKAYMLFDNGYLYTMTYPAILIATMPYLLAGIIQLLAGCFFFVLLYYLYYSIIYKHHIRSLIAFLIIIPFVTVLFTGNFFVFLSIGIGIKLLILITLETGLFCDAGEVKPC